MLNSLLTQTIKEKGFDVNANDNEVTITLKNAGKNLFFATFEAENDKKFINSVLNYNFNLNYYLREKLGIKEKIIMPYLVYYHFCEIYQNLEDLLDHVLDYVEKNGSPSKNTIRSYWEFDAFKINDDDSLEFEVEGPLQKEIFCIKNYKGRLEKTLDKLIDVYDPIEETRKMLNIGEFVDFETYLEDAFMVADAIDDLKMFLAEQNDV